LTTLALSDPFCDTNLIASAFEPTETNNESFLTSTLFTLGILKAEAATLSIFSFSNLPTLTPYAFPAFRFEMISSGFVESELIKVTHRPTSPGFVTSWASSEARIKAG
jgi:hypothetical protein